MASTQPTEPEPLGTDVVLGFEGGTKQSTSDISDTVIDWIRIQVDRLGPDAPPAPVKPVRKDYSNDFTYGLAYTAWLAESAAWAAQNPEAVAWNLAMDELERLLQDAAGIGEALFSASASYPAELVAHNDGAGVILPGESVTVEINVDAALVNSHLPQVGDVHLLQTGGTSTLTFINTGDTINPGEVIFRQPLSYNPAAVTFNLSGETTTSTISAELAPRTQDTDIADNGDFVEDEIGVTLSVLPGGIQPVLDAWEDLASRLEGLERLWELVSPFINWEDILQGLIPLPQLP